ncbi:uncharacterized protein LOC110928073 [Helianthus annuus]|uniref:uncharacterized protein LOC110928073 n=1 Tax=Helianthus annuus TaxID=4232 RepID=UPI000B9064EB|nr:uncharacterized protein LOC110928073 [Helianthus annuus]
MEVAERLGLEDSTTWKDLDGNNRPFRSFEVWQNIRSRKQPVMWVNAVWFSQCIPRHSFHLWLVIKNKLKTQDRLAVWEAGSETNLRLMCCPLCMTDRDSRDHLFFRCSFAQQVWLTVRSMVNMEDIDGSWQSILGWLDLNASSKKTEYIIGKLVIAASTYFIWQERNNRLFSNNKASAEVVSEKIKGIVRLRLMGFKLKSGATNQRWLKKWNIVSSEAEIDPG